MVMLSGVVDGPRVEVGSRARRGTVVTWRCSRGAELSLGLDVCRGVCESQNCRSGSSVLLWTLEGMMSSFPSGPAHWRCSLRP